MGRFDYPRMVHDALRQVVRLALSEVAAEGLEGDHHFYITFHTSHPGVQMPAFLRDIHPETITIILQNQFWDLEPGADSFSVTLTFSGARQRLTVPYAAIESFADPGVEFGLRFEPPRQPAGGEAPAAAGSSPAEPVAEPAEQRLAKPGEVVRLDEFRKR